MNESCFSERKDSLVSKKLKPIKIFSRFTRLQGNQPGLCNYSIVIACVGVNYKMMFN